MEDDSERQPRYAGEDNRPVSQMELYGWYAYGLAAEVFAVCGVGSFLPVTLEQMARENGVLRSDMTTPCMAAKKPDDGSADPSRLFKRDGDDNICVVHLLGHDVNTASFAMYTFSLAVLVQALTLVSISAIADHGTNRKRLLLVLAFTGATACMLFLVVFPKIYFVASLLVVISVTCLGSSFVLLNSYLPVLVSNHPTIRSQEQQQTGPSVRLSRMSTDSASDSLDGLDDEDPLRTESFPKPALQPDNASPKLQLSNQISSKGVGIGYGAAVLVQILSILTLIIWSRLLPATSATTIPLRFVLFGVGLWWAIFTIPTALWLRDRPGPPLPPSLLSSRRRNAFFRTLSLITFAWRSLYHTLLTALRLRQALIFLIAWFLLSDGIATVSGTAILFAKTELRMATASVALVSIVATTSGLLGAFAWPLIARRFQLPTNKTIIACICLFEIIPIYGLLGYIPFIQRWGVGGLQQPWEIFPLAFIHGFVMGGLSSHCRAFFGLLIPPGHEAAFYALYAVTDKGSSVIGPAVVGRIVDATGHIRLAFWFLAVLIVAPAPLIWCVDVEKGRRDAVAMAGVMGGRKERVEDNGQGHRDGPQGGFEQEGLLAEEER
ncbi:MFS transporter family protein [Saccharata proteae CBS 121410]|uniref:Autophagy-related protein n=1 Tax=Saccharata proteae CBS 121410 TaxID=1314787 RepID=A0A9P4HP54_9PEZI|nr:MFS transporter family protein [Saccharata proteae CBS 121410]